MGAEIIKIDRNGSKHLRGVVTHTALYPFHHLFLIERSEISLFVKANVRVDEIA